MQIHTKVFDKQLHFKYMNNKVYKHLLTYIECKDNIGLCNYIDKLTDKNYNVYQKFILMLHLYKTCIDDKITYTKKDNKYMFYLDDIINSLPTIIEESWVEIDNNVSILVSLPTTFYMKTVNDNSFNITAGEMNEYFVDNCIKSIKIGDSVHNLSPSDINQLPSNIFNNIIQYIRSLDISLQQINVFGDLKIKLSVFSLLNIIILMFKTDMHNLCEFEYVLRKHAKLSNYDDISMKTAHEFADIYSHELQAQKDAIDDAKRQTTNIV